LPPALFPSEAVLGAGGAEDLRCGESGRRSAAEVLCGLGRATLNTWSILFTRRAYSLSESSRSGLRFLSSLAAALFEASRNFLRVTVSRHARARAFTKRAKP